MNSELFTSIDTLKKLYRVKPKSFDVDNVEPKFVKKFKEELSKKVDSNAKIRANVDLNELYNILLRNFKTKTLDFTTRERNNLPFILFRSNMPKDVFVYLIDKCMDFDRESRLVKVLFNYFYNYSDNEEKTNLLKQKLLLHFRTHNVSDFRKKITRNVYSCRTILFSQDSSRKVAELYKEYPLSIALENLGLSTPELKKSKFVSCSLLYFFKSNEITSKKYDIFDDLDRINFVGFLDLKPVAVSSVIRLTDKLNNAIWKEKLINFCQRNFGDPRINRYKWSAIDDDARKIFLKWMASKDLDLFFRIIERTAVDHMWKYRSAFWKAYLPYVTNTWVFFGSQAALLARSIARDQMLAYGTATGGASSNHSAFIFEIGEYIFCEWSHNGRLYIWHKNYRAIQNKIVEFGSSSINKRDVTNSVYSAAYVHNGSDMYRWQSDVADWISSHCGIYKTRKDWRLK